MGLPPWLIDPIDNASRGSKFLSPAGAAHARLRFDAPVATT